LQRRIPASGSLQTRELSRAGRLRRKRLPCSATKSETAALPEFRAFRQ
jgi:hypothetical protein